jgi:predicted ATPase
VSDAGTDTTERAVWRVELLGRVRALAGDRVITHFGSRKLELLLARLAIEPRRMATREELVDMLWPEAELSTGLNRLRQTLFALRRLLEPPGSPDVLLVQRGRVGLQPGRLCCDVAEFEARLRARDGGGALALYVGELLPGHHGDWVEQERSRLAALADQAAALAEAGANAGRGLAAAGAETATTTAPPSAPSPASSPPTAGLQAPAPALPAFVARFFGREAELAALARQLGRHRLLTLTGAGGSGKTRLAVELARRERARFDTVAFVALADCRQGDELPLRLRAALLLPVGAADMPAQLGQFLQDRRTLLVLDNFEQLVEAGGTQELEALLHAHPGLHLIVSSRRRLGAEGERCVEVPPLPLPEADADLARCAANPAVAMFVDRAQAARAGFHLHARNRAGVVALCSTLQGVPLAIELAASRAHALSVADIRRQLETGLERHGARLARLGRPSPAGERHASLDAALDWSWQLLAPARQQALAALSVFRDGFTADAAAAVWQRPDAAAALEGLVADSLLRTHEASETGAASDRPLATDDAGADGPGGAELGAAMRFELLDMVREYAAARLMPDEALRLRQRHRDWYLVQARARPWRLTSADEANLHEALSSALADDLPLQVLQLALAAEPLWERGGVSPAVQRIWLAALQRLGVAEASVAAGDADAASAASPLLQRACSLFARHLYEAGDTATAQALAARALALAGGHRARRAEALAVQLRLRWKSRPRADDGLSEALREALALTLPGATGEPGLDAAGLLRTRAELLNLLGEVMVQGQHDAEAALAFYDEALALFEQLGEDRLAWDVRLGQGLCAQRQHRHDDALALHGAVARAAERQGDDLLLIDACNNLAVVCTLARRWDEAVRHGRRQLQLATRRYARYMQLLALWNLARPLARSGHPGPAGSVLAFCVREWQTRFAPLTTEDLAYVRRVRRLVARQLGAVPAALAWSEGERLDLASAVGLALGPAPGPPPEAAERVD